MNRRGFLSALALAPVAAVIAPTVRPGFASGGYVRPPYGVVGHIGPEITNLPQGSRLLPGFTYPHVGYGVASADFFSLPPVDTPDREYVTEVACGSLRDLYLANSAL